MRGRRFVGFAFALVLHLSTIALLVRLSMPTLSRNAGGQQAAVRASPPTAEPAPKPKSREDEVREDIDHYLP